MRLADLFENTDESKWDDYLHGYCHVLAMAIHAITRLPLVVATVYSEEHDEFGLVHAWCRLPDGRILDAYGADTVADRMEEEFSDDSTDPTFNISNVTISQLIAVSGNKNTGRPLRLDIKDALPYARECIRRAGVANLTENNDLYANDGVTMGEATYPIKDGNVTVKTKKMGSGGCYAFRAVTDGKIAATGEFRMDPFNGTGWVQDIRVHPLYRRRGIATAIYDHFGTMCRVIPSDTLEPDGQKFWDNRRRF